MPNITELDPKPRKDLHVFFVLDTSGSMEGAKISTLNRAMEETLEALSAEAKKNGDAKLKIAVLEFNSGANWVTSNGPEDLEGDFIWEPLKSGGLTDMGAALTELGSKLSRNAFLNSMTGALMPVIIFMTDGYATDDYSKALETIRANKWFRHSTKIGFALGDDADLKMISSVVGNSEAVIRTSDLELFKRLLKFVTVTASKLVSSTVTTTQKTTGAQIIKTAQDQGELDPGTQGNLDPGSYDPEPIDPEGPVEDPWDVKGW